PYFQQKLEKLMPTLRKYNAHLVIATQSPSSILKSSLRSMILDNFPTQLFFANPQAKEIDYIEGYNLTETEYQFIKNTPPSERLFLYKQERESMICRLNLNPLPDYLKVLSGNAKSIREVENLREVYGDASQHWLPHFMQQLEPQQKLNKNNE